MNYWLLLSPIGMILIGLLTIIYWRTKHKSKLILFAWGGLLWFMAIMLKSVLDYTVMPYFYEFINNLWPAALLVIASITLGLRTGFFESGISYLMLKGKLKKPSWNDTIAIGIGFGASEAILFGVLSLINMLVLMNPAFMSTLSEVELTMLEAQLSQNTIIVVAAWLERFFALLVHVFATALVIKALTKSKKKFLWWSIAFKSLIDTPVLLLQSFISESIVNAFIAESYIVLLGLAGFYGLKWLKNQ
ncbi:MAG: YhfC family glutamic-type intramembrane protease [Candidatus Nanoarchaeia archaeon]|jgi:uncharacterized membrane protein YhfC